MPRKKLTEEEKADRKLKMENKAEVKRISAVMKHQLQRCKKAIERGLRNPTYNLSIGDRVELGHLTWIWILDHYDDYKYYKILIVNKEYAYGKRVGTSLEIRYVLWTDLKPYRTTEECKRPKSFIEDEDVFFQYSQRSIGSIFGTYYGSGGLNLNPDYQRDLVWSDEQKIALIDSVFRNVDIGKFAIIRRSFKDDVLYYYEVLDGKQRIQALIDFYESRFEYKGRRFIELCTRDQYHFEEYRINWAETEPLTDEQKYRYFLKLNVSGVPMSKEHLKRVKNLLKQERKRNKNVNS